MSPKGITGDDDVMMMMVMMMTTEFSLLKHDVMKLVCM
jgi:hypothetical protein